jgi:NAD(P)-dependent dehydrogenase (short-subunit alcohol dehydrogenase family)
VAALSAASRPDRPRTPREPDDDATFRVAERDPLVEDDGAARSVECGDAAEDARGHAAECRLVLDGRAERAAPVVEHDQDLAITQIVAAGYHSGRDRAESLCEALAGLGAETSTHQGNVGSPDDCRRTIEEAIDRHGRLDILVNDASVTSDRPVLKLTDDDWRRVVNVNLSGACYMSRAILPHMRERGASRIVNISSIIGEVGNVGQVNHAASKSGRSG